MRYFSRALSFLLALIALPAFAWSLWDSPYGNTETPDQQQLTEGVGYISSGNSGIGQTFTPAATPLVRLDVKVKNRTDPRPGVLRIWKWEKDLPTTVKQPPLFEDIVDMAGRDDYQLRTFFPRLPVQTGVRYYFQVTRPVGADFYLAGDPGTTDLYPGGDLWANSAGRKDKDLWFRAFTTPRGPTQLPIFQGSDPALPWTPPAAPGPPPPRADYYDYAKHFADINRTNAINGDGKYSPVYTAFDAFLYRETRDEQYAKNVVLMFRCATKWRTAHPTEEVGFPWMERPGIAYLWVRKSPSLTVADHAMIRNLLLDSARKHWRNREGGAMNRSLGSAVGYLLASQLFPDVPEAA
ncbi:MAG TPA: hypothetical protein VGM23_06410, partial [Armatimonadota bacterium]